MRSKRSSSEGTAVTVFLLGDVLAQVREVADHREWTLVHVVRKLVLLGLPVYLDKFPLPIDPEV